MDTSWRKNYLRYKLFFLNILSQYRERADWKAYLEILLSLVTVSIFSVFALRPTILTIAELIKQIEEKKETVDKMDSKIQSLSKAQTLYDRHRGNIELLTETAIPKSSNSDIFARQVEGISAKNNVGISVFTLGKALIFGDTISTNNQVENENPDAPPTETTSKLPFSISALVDVNDYSKIIDFVGDFEKLRMPPETNTLELSLKEQTENGNRALLLFIEGNLLYIPDISENNTE